jgi:O-antigen ligase
VTTDQAQRPTSPQRTRTAPPDRNSNRSAILLVGYVILLFAIPARLTIHALGAAGSLASIYGVVLFARYTARRLLRGRASQISAVPLILIVFTMAVLLSYAAAASRPITAAELSNADRGLLSLIAWAGVALTAAEGLRTRESILRVVRALATAAAAMAMLGLYQYISGSNPFDSLTIPGLTANQQIGSLEARSGLTRVTGTATHPIEFSVVLAMVVGIAIVAAVTAQTRGARLFRIAAAGLIAIGIPLAVARSGIVALVVLLVLVIPRLDRVWRRRFYVGLIPGIVVVRLSFPGLVGTIRGLFFYAGNDPSSQARTADYPVVWQYFHQRPILGQGFSTFIPELYRTLDNQILGSLVETGLVGVIAFTTLLLAPAILAFRAGRSAVDPVDRILGQVLVGSLGAAFASSLTFDALGFPMYCGVLFLLIGLCGAYCRDLTPDRRDTFRYRWQRTRPQAVDRLAAGMLIVLLISAAGYYRRGHSDQWISSGSGLVTAAAQTANPLTYQPDVSKLNDVLYRRINSESVRNQLRETGFRAPFTIAIGNGSLMTGSDVVDSGPLLRVAVRSSDPAMAQRTVVGLMSTISTELNALQADSGVPAGIRARFTDISISSEAGLLQGSVKRFALAIVVLGAISWLQFARLSALARGATRSKRHSHRPTSTR